MKTIITLLLSVVLLLLSGLILYFSINTIDNAFAPYANIDTNVLYDFTIPLLIYALLQLGLSLYIFMHSTKLFHMFLKYYDNYKQKKRDKQIHNAVEEAKYDALFKDMKNTNQPDKLDEVVKEFYQAKQGESKGINSLKRFIEKLVDGEMEDIKTTRDCKASADIIGHFRPINPDK